MSETKLDRAYAALTRAETHLSDAYESGNERAIARAETTYSDALARVEDLERRAE